MMSDTSTQPRRLAAMVWAVCALSPCAALAGGKSTDIGRQHMMFVSALVVQDKDQPTGEPSEPGQESLRLFTILW